MLATLNSTASTTSTSMQSSYISIKNIKNSIIGSPTAKAALVRDGIVPSLIEWLQVARPSGEDPPIHEQTVIEAAHVISSLSYGSPDALHYLLVAHAPQALLNALVYLQPTDSPALKAALTRALRSIAVSLAEAIGPAMWGLDMQLYSAEASRDAMDALEDLFQVEALDVYLPLLADSSIQTSSEIALLIGKALRHTAHRQSIVDWLPPAERTKGTKGKRGWEKVEPTRSSDNASGEGSWVAQHLVAIMQTKNQKAQEATLLGLAAIVKDNAAIASAINRPFSDADVQTPLATLIYLAKSRNPEVKVAACLCIMQVIRSTPATVPPIPLTQGPALTLVAILNNMISSTYLSRHARTCACFIMASLVADDQPLQQAATDCGSLARLVQVAQEVTPISDEGWPEDEPESLWRLREASLRALACCALEIEDVRRTVLQINPPILPIVSISLTHPKSGVRYSAAQCARTLSRSVSLLRTSFGESDVSMRLLTVVKEETDCRVRDIALRAVANMIHDFAPSRVALLDSGALTAICALTHHEDESMALSALCTIRNALYRSRIDEKRSMLIELGWDHFATMLQSPNIQFKEQAVACLRNIATGSDDTDLVVRGIGSERLSGILKSLLETGPVDTVVHALYALLGIIGPHNSGNRSPAIAVGPLLACVRNCLSSPSPPIRRVAVLCVSQLILHRRHRELREAGIENVLRSMLSGTTDPHGREDDKETKENIRKAVGLFDNAGRVNPR